MGTVGRVGPTESARVNTHVTKTSAPVGSSHVTTRTTRRTEARNVATGTVKKYDLRSKNVKSGDGSSHNV